MAREVAVRGGWQVKDDKRREVGHYALSTMSDNGEVDLRRFFRTVWRGKWVLLLTIAATMGATLYWVSEATPLYTADVLIAIETRPSSIVRVDQAVQDVNSDPDAQINTEIAVLQSRALAARVVRALGLEKDPEFAPEDRVNDNPASNDANDEAPRDEVSAYASKQALLSALDRVKSFLTSAWAGVAALKAQSVPPTGEEQRDAELIGATDEREAATLLSRFLRSLSVEAEENSRLIHIGFTSSDSQKATKIANKIVEEYIAHQLETKSEGARRAAEWLETRLAELGNTVKSLEQDVDQRRAESGSNSIGIVQQRLGELTTQLVSAQTATAAARARYDQVRRVLESRGNLDALPAIIGSTSIQALRAKHTELLGRLADLRTIYGENHPQILSGRAELAGIQRSLNGETSTILAGLRNEMESAEMNEAALRQQLEDARREMFQLDQAEASIGQVAQRLKANPGPLPGLAQALYRGRSPAGEPAAGRTYHLAGADTA